MTTVPLTSDRFIEELHHNPQFVLDQISFLYSARAAGNFGGSHHAAAGLAVFFDEIGNHKRAKDMRYVIHGPVVYEGNEF